MNIIDFARLFQRHQGFSFPVLIQLTHLTHPEKLTWFFTSNDADIIYNSNKYLAVPMNYKFPTSQDGVPQGGTLEIDIDQQHGNYELLKWFDEADDQVSLDVIALINEQGQIKPISQLTQTHGSVTWDGEKITWSLGADDRLNMQVNAWVFDNEALTG